METLELRRILSREFTEEEQEVIDKLLEDRTIYDSALKELQLRLETLKVSFRLRESYNPIEHIKLRIKSPESILKKVALRGLNLDYTDIKESLNDLAGIRVVCTFKSDIYRIANYIKCYEDIRVIEIKDYVENPKESGYQSYHMIVEIPVYMTDGKKVTKVEIQIRTLAMDFWAALEHKIKYKYELQVPYDIKKELSECAKVADTLDDKMLGLHRKVHGLQ